MCIYIYIYICICIHTYSPQPVELWHAQVAKYSYGILGISGPSRFSFSGGDFPAVQRELRVFLDPGFLLALILAT